MNTLRTTSNTRSRQGRSVLRRGFSLIEVIVAVTIIAIFAALVAPNVLKRLGGGKQQAAMVKASVIADSIKIYLTEERNASLGNDFQLDVLIPDFLESPEDLIDPWGVP